MQQQQKRPAEGMMQQHDIRTTEPSSPDHHIFHLAHTHKTDRQAAASWRGFPYLAVDVRPDIVRRRSSSSSPPKTHPTQISHVSSNWSGSLVSLFQREPIIYPPAGQPISFPFHRSSSVRMWVSAVQCTQFKTVGTHFCWLSSRVQISLSFADFWLWTVRTRGFGLWTPPPLSGNHIGDVPVLGTQGEEHGTRKQESCGIRLSARVWGQIVNLCANER